MLQFLAYYASCWTHLNGFCYIFRIHISSADSSVSLTFSEVDVKNQKRRKGETALDVYCDGGTVWARRDGLVTRLREEYYDIIVGGNIL